VSYYDSQLESSKKIAEIETNSLVELEISFSRSLSASDEEAKVIPKLSDQSNNLELISGECTRCHQISKLVGMGDCFCSNPLCESNLCQECLAIVKNGQQDETLYCSNRNCNYCVCLECFKSFFEPCIGICRGSTCPECTAFECKFCGDIACFSCAPDLIGVSIYNPCPECSSEHCIVLPIMFKPKYLLLVNKFLMVRVGLWALGSKREDWHGEVGRISRRRYRRR
jgi:hypothetical protein